jgi:hypothetical protein
LGFKLVKLRSWPKPYLKFEHQIVCHCNGAKSVTRSAAHTSPARSLPLQLFVVQKHKAQEEGTGLHWHVVKRRKWWRKERAEKRGASVGNLPRDSPAQIAFKVRTLGRRYNCFASDHRVA